MPNVDILDSPAEDKMCHAGHDLFEHSDDEHPLNVEMQAKMSQGIVTLFGRMALPYPAERAKDDPQKFPGALGVLSLIANHSRAHPADVKAEIVRALQHFAATNAERIRVSVLGGGHVVLEGRVQSWDEREVIYKAVSSLPGVQSINDQLTLS